MDIGAFLGDMNIGPFLGHMDIGFFRTHGYWGFIKTHGYWGFIRTHGYCGFFFIIGHMDIEAFLGHMEIGAKCQGWYSWDTIPFATQIWSFGTGGLLKEIYSTELMKSCDIFKWSPKRGWSLKTGFIVSN